MARAFAEIAFTPNVVDMQTRQGSVSGYAKFLSADIDGGDHLTAREASFIQQRDGFYQATVSETGWPYVQFRGGPAGFLKVIDDRTIAYADFRGNRQYLSVGNLTGNERVALILMDYPNQRRLKIWGRVKMVSASEEPELVASLHPEGYRAKPERAVIIHVEAFDWNCPQHIPKRFTADELETSFVALHERIARLSDENRRLKSELAPA